MARTIFVTPDDTSAAPAAFVVYLPDDLYLIAAFWGAYHTLLRPDNWQEVGTLSAQDAADLFAAARVLTIPLTEA